jgi:hypothetical protein
MIKKIEVSSKFHKLSPIKTSLTPVRLGRYWDGGYVVPKELLDNISVLITFGIGPDWSFERDFLRLNPKNICIGVDYSVSDYLFYEDACLSIFKNLHFKSRWKNFKNRFERFLSWKKFIKNPQFLFINKRVFDSYQFSDCILVSDVMGHKFLRHIDKDYRCILKCDIEGGEYRIIHDILLVDNIDLLILEFHDINPLAMTFLDVINSISETYEIFHIHPNNSAAISSVSGFPDVIEVTFIKRSKLSEDELNSRLQRDTLVTALKQMDYPCDPLLEEIELIFKHE